MAKNPGLLKEEEMVFMFNKIKYKDLTKHGKFLIKEIFGPVKQNVKLKAGKTDEYMKPDFYIQYEKNKKYISMKSGRAQIIHGERLETVIKYFRELGISERTLKIIVAFHYGDGTLDGSGKQRMSYQEISYKMSELIKEANDELNSNKAFMQEVLEKYIFNGVVANAVKADYLYYGDTDLGILVSKNQVRKYISKKNWDYLENLHIGPILLRPHARYSNKQIINEYRRNTLIFYWPTIIPDLKYINDHFMD